MPEIDELQIAIEAEATDASRALDSLLGKLGQLSTTILGVGKTLDGTSYRKSTEQLKDASKAMSTEIIKAYDITDRQVQAKVKSLVATVAKLREQMAKGMQGVDYTSPLTDLQKILVDNTYQANQMEDQFRKALESLRNSKIYVSDIIVNDVGDDWDSLRKKLFGVFTRDSSNVSVDKTYEGLSEQFPNLFPEDIANEADRFRKIIEVVTQAQEQLKKTADTSADGLERAWESAIATTGDALKRLDEAIKQSMNTQAEMPKSGNIGTALNNSPLFDADKIGQAVTNITSLSDSLKGMEGITINAVGISELANAIKVMGNADISSATTNLGTLKDSLDAVSNTNIQNAVNGIVGLSSAVTMLKSSATSRDFSNLANNLTKLANVDSSRLGQTASAITAMNGSLSNLGNIAPAVQGVKDISSAIGTLGYAKIDKAIANIPLLGSALKDLMNTLSRAPVVSRNVIDMTNALAGLASQGQHVGSATRGLVNGMNGYGRSAQRASKHTMSLARAFGKFYANMFLVIRGVKALGKAIESSMSYVENLNYFEKAFEQVASKADYSGMGEQAARDYYESFSKEAKRVTSEMTGFNVLDSGELTPTGKTSLGINPTTLMNYQAMFGQMASSMDVASDSAGTLSEVMSKLGGDLASVKNLDFADVWNNLASGMAGMSRTLDKYGVNIRNVNMQQKLSALGIKENITNLNQNDKVLLRTIILLDSTRYAWTDLSGTISSSANQMRMLTSGMQNLGRMIGNLFLPAITKALPYVNALVISLQRLALWIGNLIGVDLASLTSGIGGASDAMSDILDQTDDVGDSIGKATNEAKKLKQQLMGFDELNVITSKDDSGSGKGAGGTNPLITDAFNSIAEEYLAAWDKAFAEVNNQAEKLADRLDKAFQPIKEIIQDFAIGDYFKAGQDVSNLVVSINEFLAKAIASVDWDKLGQDIGNFLRGINWVEVLSSIGELFWQAVNAAIELYVGAFETAPIETAIITALALMKFTGLGDILGKAIGKEIIKVFKPISKKIIATICKIAPTLAEIGLIIGGVILTLKSFFSMWNEGFSAAKEVLMVLGIALTAVGAVIFGAPALVAGVVAGIVALIGTIAVVVHDHWDEIVAWTKDTANKIGGFFTDAVEGIKLAFKLTLLFVNEKILNPMKMAFELVTSSIGDFFDKMWDGVKIASILAVNVLLDSIEGFINFFVDGINLFIKGINLVGKGISKIKGEDYSGIELVQKFKIERPKGYEMGGFPKAADVFYANEDGRPELVGTMNGKTAVASNTEITGIRDSIETMRESNERMQNSVISLLEVIADKDPNISVSSVVTSLKRANRESINRTGRPILSY